MVGIAAKYIRRDTEMNEFCQYPFYGVGMKKGHSGME